MRAVDEQAFDMGFGTEQYQDGNMLNEQNQLQGYFGSGGVSTFIGGGGGGSVSGGGSVVVSETPGTSNYNNKKVIYIKSKESGASIFKNGENTFSTTDSSITVDISEALVTPIELTVQKEGFTSNEKYIIDVVNNPNYQQLKLNLSTDIKINVDPYSSLYGYQDFNNISFNNVYNSGTGIAYYGQPYVPNTQDYDVFSTEPIFLIRVQYYLNGNLQKFDYNTKDSSLSVNFDNFVKKSIETPIDVLPPNVDVTINLVGPENSVIVLRKGIAGLLSGGNIITLVNGINKLTIPVGSDITIQTANIGLYRAKYIKANNGTEDIVVEAIEQNESVSTTITAYDNTIIDITSENFVILQKDVPLIEFITIEELTKPYNKNTKADFPIGIKKSSGTTAVKIYVNSNEFNFDTANSENYSILSIPAKVLTTVGRYKVIIVPSSKDGDGAPIEFTLNSVDDIYVGTPDIRNIRYPSVLRGPDFVGTDVDFTIEFQTVNTDEVRLFATSPNSTTLNDYSSNFLRLACQKDGYTKQTLNFQKLLDFFKSSVDEDVDIINIGLKLVPFNRSGRQSISGVEEFLNIKFDKGDLSIPRDVAVSRLAEGFLSQFDLSIFADETSKYLTHLAHFGNADNKLITTWAEDSDSVILKLYEPLETTVQPNQEIWISKLQANPIIETVTISGVDESFCPPLKGPNFSIEADNGVGYQAFSDLVASGSFTYNDIINKISSQNNIDTEKLNIQYVSGSDYTWTNYVHYGAAAERVNNFFYKVKVLQSYQEKYFDLTNQTFPIGYLLAEAIPQHEEYSTIDGYILQTEDSINELQWEYPQYSPIYVELEAKALGEKISNLVKTFDGFEKFLFKSENSLAYPKRDLYDTEKDFYYRVLKVATDTTVTTWYNYALESALYYDKYNVNSMKNNMPEFITIDSENNEFILFLDMIGQHFDVIWCYINALRGTKKLEHKQETGIPNQLIYSLLDSLGWKSKKAFNSNFLWEYMFGSDKEGRPKFSTSLQDANFEVWRRIANNLPYLLKHKGTARALKAVMACYGVPQSMLTIMEFGGPQDPTKGGSTQFTFDDRTAAIFLTGSLNSNGSSNVKIPWHSSSLTQDYPNGIEFRIKPQKLPNTSYTLISGSEWTLDLIQTTGSFGKLEFNFGGDQSVSTYFETSGTYYPYITSSIEYVFGPDWKTGSLDFPISLEHYSNVSINRHNSPDSSSWYEVWLATSNGTRIITSVSMSIASVDGQWTTGSTLQIGGNGYAGNIDEFRLWTVPLQRSKFENHTLFPDAINGNSVTASTSDLIFRLDFEYPKDRTKDSFIKNVSINQSYGEPFASASNMYSASAYPYQYTPYDRTVTATVPSLGFNYSNKIRFEEQELVGNLSHKVRATKKAFDRAPIDSNRLGLFFSPIKELNMDILKVLGDFNIDNYIGDPSDEYKTTYSQLDTLRHYYFERLEGRDIYEYIRLVKYIDKSLFEVLSDLAPARTNISKGLLIEPHFLERSKIKWDRPESLRNDFETSIDTREDAFLNGESIPKDAHINAEEVSSLSYELNNYDTTLDANDITTLEGVNETYNSEIDYDFTNNIESDYPTFPKTGSVNIVVSSGATLTGDYVNKFQQIGMEKNSLANIGYGLYAIRGNAIYRDYDGLFGNTEITGSRKSVFLVKETKSLKEKIQVSGYPTTVSGPVIYETITTNYDKYLVSILPFSGSIVVAGDITEVTAINGYLPTHYRFTNNLSEGMRRSYFNGSLQTAETTPDGLDPVEIFTTNPNILRVAKTGRGSGEPILEVD